MFHTYQDSTILTHRGLTVKLSPPHYYYCYLIHFDQPYHHARHFLGACQNIDARLLRHRQGNGARLMEVITQAGITWQLSRLWRVDTWEESRDLEHRLKRWSGSGQFCPICRGKGEVDLLVFMRQGHYPFSIHDKRGPRRPMPLERNEPWERD